MRSRVAFETDVANDYFTRGQYPGKHILRPTEESLSATPVPDHTLNLNNGVATLNLALPSGVNVGDSFGYELIVQDETLVESFVNRLTISVGSFQKMNSHPPSPPNPDPLLNKNDDGDKETPKGLAMPNPILVYEADWEARNFNKFSALGAIYDLPDDESSSGSHTYYINMDNIYLNTELKATKENLDIVKARWRYGMVLIGMALLRNDKSSGVVGDNSQASERDDSENPEEVVSKATAAIAPVLLPLIEHLGGLSDEDVTH